MLWDIDREDGKTDSLFVNEAKYDWIRTDQRGGPTAILHPDDLTKVVKTGHRIFGYITIACPDCQRTLVEWVYFVYGQSGQYGELKGTVGPNPRAIADSIPKLREDKQGSFLSTVPVVLWNPILEMP